MTWKHWAAVVSVIGVGILLQIPGHDAKMARGHPAEMGMTMPLGHAVTEYRTVSLEVTGMT